jgi:hypothetical protein
MIPVSSRRRFTSRVVASVQVAPSNQMPHAGQPAAAEADTISSGGNMG